MNLFAKLASLAALLGIGPVPKPAPVPENASQFTTRRVPPPALWLPSPPRSRRRAGSVVRGVLDDYRRKHSRNRSRGIPAGANRKAWQTVNSLPSW